jgi:hypothetical protein
MLLSCGKIFSQKDSVAINSVFPQNITSYKNGDNIFLDGKSYTLKYIPLETYLTLPPPRIVKFDTIDVVMLVTDTAYDTPRFTDNMDFGFNINRKDVYAMDGYLITKTIDKGYFPYTTETVGYFNYDFTPLKNKIVWMSVRKPKNKNNE